jgi:hypothetical protein
VCVNKASSVIIICKSAAVWVQSRPFPTHEACLLSVDEMKLSPFVNTKCSMPLPLTVRLVRQHRTAEHGTQQHHGGWIAAVLSSQPLLVGKGTGISERYLDWLNPLAQDSMSIWIPVDYKAWQSADSENSWRRPLALAPGSWLKLRLLKNPETKKSVALAILSALVQYW